jgi:hypothetical protein
VTPQLFRRLPGLVEAIQWDGSNCPDVFGFIGLNHEPHDDDLDDILIPTLEGTMTASVGDWIVKGAVGEFWPVKPDVFEATYEPVPTKTPRAEVVTWDWRETVDIPELTKLIAAVSGGSVHLREVVTGSDVYAVVISTTALDDLQVQQVWADYQAGGAA